MVPETSSPEFEDAYQRIIQNENPDLVLAGRDQDVVFLANYKKSGRCSTELIPVGEPYLAEMMLDKFETHQFAQQHQLPYAATFLYRNAQDIESLQAFIDTHGFPLLVKPRKGFGSINVFIVTNQQHVDMCIQDGGEVMFQEYLSPAEGLDLFMTQLKKGIPLSFHIPNDEHMVTQAVISRNGTLLDCISTKQTLVMGRTEYARVYIDPDLNRMIELYAKTLANKGWWGFLNIQSRRDKSGTWKVFELNPRLSGATSARLNLGLDELGLLLNDEKPEWNFPLETNPSRKQNHVFKYLTDHCVSDSDMERFLTKGYWIKNG
jgi:carbamoyl-phosphate synthase large subunit